jgi:phospholipase D3/4
LRLVNETQHSIDLSAMYWSLLADPQSAEFEGLSIGRLEQLGAKHGRLLHNALEAALQRGVRLRVLQPPNFSGDGNPEIEDFSNRYPKLVQITTVSPDAWYDGGIMHQKLWVFDGHSAYIGSANMDWRSLAQVKELGVIVEDDPAIAQSVAAHLANWRQFATMEVTAVSITDPISGDDHRVPAWSPLVPTDRRLPNPFPPIAQLDEPIITTSPPELCENGRYDDGDTLLRTINDAQERINIEVMNFLPTARSQRGEDGSLHPPLWQPVIMNALLRAVIQRGVHVRLLIGQWAYSSPTTAAYLQAMQAMADASLLDTAVPNGTLEIRRFTMSGWDRTTGSKRLYPDYSRVNHAKFIVTEQRVNIGTSNFTWDYFSQTGGCSFNSGDDTLIAQLQAIFERDWQSDHAIAIA